MQPPNESSFTFLLPGSLFFPPRPYKKDRQPNVSGNGWPQQNPHPTVDPHVKEIQRCEQAGDPTHQATSGSLMRLDRK
jgi:hypothetical protein